DHFAALVNSRLIDRLALSSLLDNAREPEHIAAPQEAHVEGHAAIRRCIGKGCVDDLTVTDRHVARPANQRDRSKESFAAGFRHQCPQVSATCGVAARYEPDARGGCRAIELHHEGETVATFIPMGTSPVSHAVLMPRSDAAFARVFDDDRFTERNE